MTGRSTDDFDAHVGTCRKSRSRRRNLGEELGGKVAFALVAVIQMLLGENPLRYLWFSGE